jgi:hypothetical protein
LANKYLQIKSFAGWRSCVHQTDGFFKKALKNLLYIFL